jgi:hypothetical protein
MMRNGICYRLPDSEPLTDATGYSFLPTPSANAYKTDSLSVESLKKHAVKHGWGNLAEWVAEKLGVKQSPSMLEEMMGFPIGWTDLDASETPLSHKSLNGLGEE